jgi:hypothetical protein
MKKLLLLLLAPLAIGGMFVGAFAQSEPGEPCCSIIAMDIQKNLAVARDNTTGRLYQFNAGALDMKAVKLNDAVNVSSGKITSISGAKRTYVTVRPDYGTPCCSVVSIQVDYQEPCCGMVNIINNTTNTNLAISVPKQIAATLKKGQAVSMDGATGMAIVQSSYGNSNGQMASYGYPATSGDETTGNENATDKWVITPVTNMKGVLGRLDINFPADVERNILIYQPADNKYITSVSHNDKTYTIAPDKYRFTITNVPIENVPIQKGHETRLKMGFLNVVSEGDWHLYNETKEKAFTSGNKPKKLPLPVGSYQLKLGLDFYPFVIKDGETVEY